MKKNNGPLFVAPRDNHGNKMIWDEKQNKYVVNENLYAKPLLIAPVDYEGHKMVWNNELKIYESKRTGQKYSTLSMSFVDNDDREMEALMEEAALEEAGKYMSGSGEEWKEDDEDFADDDLQWEEDNIDEYEDDEDDYDPFANRFDRNDDFMMEEEDNDYWGEDDRPSFFEGLIFLDDAENY